MPDCTVRVRKATPADRPRILEISAQIWDGDDYVPHLVDAWLADRDGELVVATLDAKVIAFAHRAWLFPEIAWFEGIQTDPAYQGRGAGKAITEYLINATREAGATHINLSTYIDNESSIHIIESYGFRLVGTFSYLERPAEQHLPEATVKGVQIGPMLEQDSLAFVEESDYLVLAQRRFAHGWKFFPFDRDPHHAISSLAFQVGAWQAGTLMACLCIREEPQHDGSITICFLDGDGNAMRQLLHHVLNVFAGHEMTIMLPVHQGRYAAAFDLLKKAGFKSWSEFKPDVFVYEMVL